MTALSVHAHKGNSLRDVSLKNLKTDRHESFQNTIKTLHSKIHNHITPFVTWCSLNANNNDKRQFCCDSYFFVTFIDVSFHLKISFVTFQYELDKHKLQ